MEGLQSDRMGMKTQSSSENLVSQTCMHEWSSHNIVRVRPSLTGSERRSQNFDLAKF